MARVRALLLLACLTGIGQVAAAAKVSDVAVKAAFLPRFARYVTWPPGVVAGTQAIHLCVIGRDPFGPQLDQAVAGETVDGRPIIVRRHPTAEGAHDCHIAFVRGEIASTGQTLAALGSAPVLTVTESAGGVQRGIIHFVIVQGRVRFVIDNERAAQTGLVLNARLLALALGVRKARK